MTIAAHVSVVIPTLHRPTLLLRAIRSVLAQTHPKFDVVVVVDGPDQDTVAALQSLDDSRVQFIVNPRSMTAAVARNEGVARSSGDWIAFLDDDDEWLPTKLQRQLEFARERGSDFVTCRSRVVTPIATYVWPDVIYDNAQPVDEYVFDRSTFFAGASFVQTSSYLIRRSVFDKAPFRDNTPHDDWDFLLGQCKGVGTRLETVPEVLLNHYIDEHRPSLSTSATWKASLSWIDGVRPLLTQRAYAAFCLCVVGPRAANELAYSAFLPLISRALARGSPRLWHFCMYLVFWAIPQPARRWLRAMLRGRRTKSEIPSGSIEILQ